MYRPPKQFEIPNEIKAFQNDCDSLGMIQDGDNWYVTSEWCLKFKNHFDKILKLAESGEPWAQYNLGNIYLGGYLYTSQEKFERNYESDISKGSEWLVKAAQQGFVAAVDNLVVVGIGPEAERLRLITKDVEKEHPEFIKRWEQDKTIPVITPSLFEAVWERAYGESIKCKK